MGKVQTHNVKRTATFGHMEHLRRAYKPECVKYS